MSPRVTRDDLERLRATLARTVGLQLDDGKLELLAAAVEERLDALREPSAERYAGRLAVDGQGAELHALAARLTVGETYFFRNEHDLAAFQGIAIPERMRARAATRQLRILSAGCSTGEEPYSLAMLVLQQPQLAGWNVSIHGVDVNAGAVQRARAGRYSEWALRVTPPDVRDRFFRRVGGEWVLDDAVRRMVSFEERNLLASDDAFWRADAWDVVFCRNVTMYLVPEAARRVISHVTRSLSPGGHLFLGHAETLRGVSSAFHLRQAGGAFYYQLRGAVVEGVEVAAAPAATSTLPDIVERSASWVDAIRQASERVARLAAPAHGAPAAPAAAGHAATVARALELVRDERYADALGALPPVAGDADALLLRAALLAITGAVEQAEDACRRVLERDELNPEAHYVMALCREHAGDPDGAASQDRYAVYLEPSFAMPRLHLGLMAKRAGEVEAARRELGTASVLLAYEDASRMLLLGGGFTRDALIELCRRELRACGGAT